MMSHVLEHVYDPVDLLRESYRVLKPRGVVVITTPNISSFLHSVFSESWQGLDPPRHLRLFSISTLTESARRAGFAQVECWTSAANTMGIASDSFFIRAGGRTADATHRRVSWYLAAVGLQVVALAKLRFRKDSGEECVLLATK